MVKSENYDQELERVFSLLREERVLEGVEICEGLEQSNPDRVEHLYLLALSALLLKDIPRAIQLMEEGHNRAPEVLEFVDALSALHARVGQMSESVYFTKMGVMAESNPVLAKYAPDEFENIEDLFDHIGLPQYVVEGWVSFHERDYHKAIDLVKKQIALNGGDADSYYLLACAYKETHEYQNAIAAAKTAIKLDPENLDPQVLLADLLLDVGLNHEAVEVFETVIKRNPDNLDIRQHLICAKAHCGVTNWSQISDDMGGYVDLLQKTVAREGGKGDRKLPKQLQRIRVAFLVNEHAISHYAPFLETFLSDRTEERIRTAVYQQYSQPFTADSRMRRIADDWRSTFDIDDMTFAHIIANDDIHVLVDMCGLTPGNRQPLLAKRAAPVQVSWLASPSWGVKETVDAMLLDEFASNGNAQGPCGVQREILEGPMFGYPGASVVIDSGAQTQYPVVKNGHVTFGGVIDLSCLKQSALLWADVLKATPNSRLLLGAHGYIDESSRSSARTLFETLGVADRVDILGADHISTNRAEFIHNIDVLLDTMDIPNLGLVCDCLWMSVPVVSLVGNWPEGRLGGSALTAAGLSEWVFDEPMAFVEMATAMVADQSKFVKTRDKLRQRIQASSLCDTPKFAQQMEVAIEKVCRRYQDSA